MALSDEFIRLARAHAHRRKLKFKRGNYADPGWHKLGSGWFGGGVGARVGVVLDERFASFMGTIK